MFNLFSNKCPGTPEHYTEWLEQLYLTPTERTEKMTELERKKRKNPYQHTEVKNG